VAVDVTTLKSCELFSGFTATGLKIFAQIARSREVAAGMSIFLAGTSGDSLFIIESGSVVIGVSRGDDNNQLCTLGPGEHFGDLALLRAGKRAVTARALKNCALAEIKRSDFNAAMKKTPQACFKLMLAVFGSVAARISAVQADLLELV